MAEEARLNIRFKDKETVSKLEKLAQKKGLSMNQFVCEIIENYLAVSDKYVLTALPLVVKSMIKEELDTLETTHKDVLKDIYITMIKLRKVTETLVTFLLPEFNEAEYDTLKTDELLKLLNALESWKNE